MIPRCYPLLFEPILVPKRWGGRSLTRWGKQLPDSGTVGESWELADLAETSPWGRGGQAARSVIRNGPLAGRTLDSVMQQWGEGLLGSAAPAADGGFPLLVKLLDAAENLSVQVHPSPGYAARHRSASLKDECWYVLAAADQAAIYLGTQAGIGADALRLAATNGELERCLERVPVRPGLCFTVPSGTIHAIGAGIVLAEFQSPSDTTFRLYDWDRPGTELQVRRGLECAALGAAPPPLFLAPDRTSARLARTATFELELIRLPGGTVDLAGRCAVLMGVAGSATLASPAAGDVQLGRGSTCLVPASLGAALRISAAEPAEFLCARLSSD